MRKSKRSVYGKLDSRGRTTLTDCYTMHFLRNTCFNITAGFTLLRTVFSFTNLTHRFLLIYNWTRDVAWNLIYYIFFLLKMNYFKSMSSFEKTCTLKNRVNRANFYIFWSWFVEGLAEILLKESMSLKSSKNNNKKNRICEHIAVSKFLVDLDKKNCSLKKYLPFFT